MCKAAELLIKALVAASKPDTEEPPKGAGRELYVSLRHDLMVRIEYLNRLRDEHRAIAASYTETAQAVLTGKPKAEPKGHRYG